MTRAEVLYRASAYDTPDDPFTHGAAPGFRHDDDLGLAVENSFGPRRVVPDPVQTRLQKPNVAIASVAPVTL